MDDNEAKLAELKRQFQNPDFRVDIVDWSVQQYEAELDPDRREVLLMSWWNWSLSQRWAWDVLTELSGRALERQERPRILGDFGMMVATGKRKSPDSQPGHPANDINSDLNILATVRVLVNCYDFKKTAAYKLVSDWSKVSGAGCLEPDGIRKLVRRLETRRPFPRSRAARN